MSRGARGSSWSRFGPGRRTATPWRLSAFVKPWRVHPTSVAISAIVRPQSRHSRRSYPRSESCSQPRFMPPPTPDESSAESRGGQVAPHQHHSSGRVSGARTIGLSSLPGSLTTASTSAGGEPPTVGLLEHPRSVGGWAPTVMRSALKRRYTWRALRDG
jgi:hypothetical protein